jgi:HEAT repeat protein
VLAELIADTSLPSKLRLLAASSLIRAPQPQPVAVDLLLGMSNDPLLKQHAVYGLGSFARRMREAGHAAPAASVTARLVTELHTADSVPRRVDVLRAIANSGDSAALKAVEPWLSNEEVPVRAAAVQALRLMEHARVASLLTQVLDKETDALVQLAVLDAAGPHAEHAPLRVTIAERGAKAKDVKVRHAAVRVLGAWLAKHEELRAVLQQVAEKDARDSVRQEARDQLGSAG